MSLRDCPEVTAAFKQLRSVFDARPRPWDAHYCPCCFEDVEMRRFLRKEPAELTADDLESIYWKAYSTWGDWPSLAHYVPRLLELYVDHALCDGEFLRHQLYLAAHPHAPKAFTGDPLINLKEPMSLPEQRSLFEFFGALLTARLCAPDETPRLEDLREEFDFLASFGAPLEPLLEQWSRSDQVVCRARFCVLLAYLAFTLDARFQADTTYLSRVQYLPENRTAVARFIAPEFVADYLTAHAEDVARVDPDGAHYVELAFDWAARELAAERARLPVC